MRATTRREDGKLRQTIQIRDHTVEADEPKDHGGEDAAPSPQELLAASPRQLHRDHDGDVRRSARAGTSAT